MPLLRWGVPLRPPVVVIRKPAPPPPPKVEVVEEVVETESEAVAAVEAATAAFSLRYFYWRATQWLLVMLGLQALASVMPRVVEYLYSQTLYYYIARWLSVISGFFYFSVGEAFFILLILYFFFWTIWYVRRALRGETMFFYVLKLLFLHLLYTASVLGVVFLFLWGFNYQRLPIRDTMGLDNRPARSDELQAIGARIVEGVNSNHAAARNDQEWNRTSRLPIPRQRLVQSIETSFQGTALLGDARLGGLGPPKPLYLSRLASLFGIKHIYIPYTAEPTFNEDVPDSELPFIIAHQKAHQRGFAREDEANLVAYLVCTGADEAYVRYSGYLHAVKVLDVIERAGIASLKNKIAPGPSYDLDARMEFKTMTRSQFFTAWARRLETVHLRANRVRLGVANYDEDIPLIIAYYLKYPTAK